MYDFLCPKYWLVLVLCFTSFNFSQVTVTGGETPEISEQPPYTDYCEMLSQEIQGRKHAFLAGNKTYYVGGIYHSFKLHEHETIGLTHPFFHDLRGRGFGLAKHDSSGYGHDFRGWEFYNKTRVAYGTVMIDGERYEAPVPVSMKWRPDKVICEYEVGGVQIHEEKFIANNDVACSIISSDKPIKISFDGRSLYIPNLSLESKATVQFDRTNNSVHITEDGTVTTHPVQGETVPGMLIYDGMSTVLSCSIPIVGYASNIDDRGQCHYSFEINCDDQGVAIAWAMADSYPKALADVQEVLDDSQAALDAKSQTMNDLLNYQIPYFRCSNQNIVDIYYYLWAIYLMYYIDVQEGWEMYPHTQTAVNNFLGMHRYDANFQIMVGSWTANKKYYAYGNVLHWKPLLPYARSGGALPDNKGIAWFSPVWGTTTEHVIGAWQIYQHTGDLEFLHDCYDNYFKVLFKDGMHSHWGCHYDAAECLREMAILTGDEENPDRWLELVNFEGREHWLNNMWESHHPGFFGGGGKHLDWSGFAYLRNSYFPEEWAYEMTRHWAVDSRKGFFWKVPLSSRSIPDLETVNDPEFASTPDTNYYALIGMYKSNVGRYANQCALAHLESYNMHWGIPIAPEAWSSEPAPWGDQYSNFNAGKILLILEGIAGIQYSVPDDTLVVCENFPEEWHSMEVRVPVEVNGVVRWPCIIYERSEAGDSVEKTISIQHNPFKYLKIQPWLEEGLLLTATGGYELEGQPRNHLGYSFEEATQESIFINISQSD